MINIRKEAASTLETILVRGGYSSLTVKETLQRIAPQTTEQERRFFTSLVYTTLEHLPSIDAVLQQYTRMPLNRIKPYVLVCLRMGLAQLKYMEGVADRAAIYETVELIRRSGYRGLSGFVNGVLRTAQREGCACPVIDRQREPLKALELQYDMPQWIIQLWAEDYGMQQAEELLQRMNSERAVCLRVNLLKGTVQETKEILLGQCEAQQSEVVSEAFYAEHIGDITGWELYRSGRITVQDESSMLAALATGARPGERVLDLCAAPGGKSVFMAQMMQNRGTIISRDLHPHRVQLIEETAKRLGASCIRTEVSDASQPREEDREQYDRVLLDAPCSGLGMLRAKPDIKLHHKPEELSELMQLQRKMLRTAAEAVKPGGTLVYSTCTLHKGENDDQIRWFLKEYPQFRLKDLQNCLPTLPECDRLWNKYLTLWPKQKGHDGFFVACLEK